MAAIYTGGSGAHYAMIWSENNLTASIGGTAASKVSATVGYAGGNQRLLIEATSSFDPGGTLVVSGRLELDYDNDGVSDAIDNKTVAIQGVFAGGGRSQLLPEPGAPEKCLHPVGALISIARLR